MYSIMMTFIFMFGFLYLVNFGSKDPIEHAVNEVIFWVIVCSNLVLTGLYDTKRK